MPVGLVMLAGVVDVPVVTVAPASIYTHEKSKSSPVLLSAIIGPVMVPGVVRLIQQSEYLMVTSDRFLGYSHLINGDLNEMLFRGVKFYGSIPVTTFDAVSRCLQVGVVSR